MDWHRHCHKNWHPRRHSIKVQQHWHVHIHTPNKGNFCHRYHRHWYQHSFLLIEVQYHSALSHKLYEAGLILCRCLFRYLLKWLYCWYLYPILFFYLCDNILLLHWFAVVYLQTNVAMKHILCNTDYVNIHQISHALNSAFCFLYQKIFKQEKIFHISRRTVGDHFWLSFYLFFSFVI